MKGRGTRLFDFKECWIDEKKYLRQLIQLNLHLNFLITLKTINILKKNLIMMKF